MPRRQKIYIDEDQLRIASEKLRALAHPLRLMILKHIDELGGEVQSNLIYESLSLEQSITSQHLQILRRGGMIESVRKGKFVYYTLNYSEIAKCSSIITRFLKENEI
jgi:ArsR family transcriptional regulator